MKVKRIGAVGLAMASVITTIVVLAQPASAAASDCRSGYACLWINRDYSGGPYRQEDDLGLHGTGFWENDETSSVWNRRSGGAMYLYGNSNGSQSEGVLCVPKGYAVSNLANYHFDDKISSYRLTTQTCGSGVDTGGSWKGY
jgi:hypothetical protein